VVSRINEKIRLKFEIEDSGIGIPEDKIVEIFESFSRVQSKERFYEGTGLGLSIAKNLVEQQGGSISARSVVGSGSTFFFELDFLISQATSVASDAKKDLSAIDTTRPLRLLLVEDNKMNQLVARKTLEKQWSNLSITVADNGAIAVEILKNEDFDIILMDMQMPVMDGYEATLHIRNNMGTDKAKTPILAMTANAYISKEENVNNIGLDDYVLKPFDPEDLLIKIHQYARRR
jgi:CheY-like chemotaxis protein